MSKNVTAFILALSICMSFSGCNNKDDNNSTEVTSLNDDLVISSNDNDTQEENQGTTEDVTTETPKHESPVEEVSYTMSSQISNINTLMNYDDDDTKNQKFSLSELAPNDANIQSFTFVFYSSNDSNIGTYKGGCGISVDEDCPSATDDGWYQSDDFEFTADGSYLEVKWDVPSDIQKYIASDGEVQIGYWWSDATADLKLSEVICTYSNTVSIPCDETKNTNPDTILKYENDDTKNLEIPLSELVSKGNVPQCITVDISNADKSSSASLGKIVMGMGIAMGEDYYESKNLVQLEKNGNSTITWIIPQDIIKKIDSSGKLTIGYWWGEQSSISIDNVTVKSAVADGSISTSADANTNENTGEEPKADNTSTLSGDIQSITSAQIVEDMKIGWNLGNTLDSYDEDTNKIVGSAETYFGNPETTKAMIDKVKSAGFKAVRIPVSWTNHIDDNNKIDEEWLARVKEVIDYVIDNDMYAIVNVHHDDYTWLNPLYSEQDRVTKRLTAIWEQLSTEFKDYDQHLLFEGLNEPRVIGGTDEWTCGTAEERDVINQLEQVFVDTVRASGGNNKYRTLIVTPHAAALDETGIKDLIVPKDDHVIVSIHWYSPYDFVGNESDVNTWGTDTDKANLDKGFKLLNDTFISKDIPVIIGEFGAVQKDNDDTRALYYEYYVQSAKQYGITCFVWDNNEDFGLLDRTSLTWDNNNVVSSIIKGSN